MRVAFPHCAFAVDGGAEIVSEARVEPVDTARPAAAEGDLGAVRSRTRGAEPLSWPRGGRRRHDRALGVADAGELMTLQRAAYVTEAQLHDQPFLPPLTERWWRRSSRRGA